MKYEEYFPSERNDVHYQRYIRFIEERKQLERPIGVLRCKGYEVHHIVPRVYIPKECERDRENLIALTPREHYIAHLILWKTFNKEMVNAFHFFIYKRGMKYRLTSRQYESLRKEFINEVPKDNNKERRRVYEISTGKCRYVKSEELDDFLEKNPCFSLEKPNKQKGLRKVIFDTLLKKHIKVPIEEVDTYLADSRYCIYNPVPFNPKGRKKVHNKITGEYKVISLELIEEYKNNPDWEFKGNPSMAGRKHSEETKAKIREKRKHQTHLRTGVKQSEETKEAIRQKHLEKFSESKGTNFGNWWIHRVLEDGTVERRQIPAGTTIPDGFVRGNGVTVRSSQKDSIKRVSIYKWLEDGSYKQKRHPVNEPIPDGWIIGTPPSYVGYCYNKDYGTVKKERFNQYPLPGGWFETEQEAIAYSEDN